MAIKDWSSGLRPRERLLAHGAEALSSAELLAIFLRVGVAGKSAVDLARELMAHFDDSLVRLGNAPIEDICRVKGMGVAKSVQLKATLELARRALTEQLKERDALCSPAAVRDWLQLRMAGLPHEIFMVLLLDAQNRLITAVELFRGTLTQTSVYPREVVKLALAHNAAAVILAHNHPSGVAEPSRADDFLTQSLKQALALVDVRVLDHVIVGSGATCSFAERGML
ncbi:MAG: DNA repair protein RadC [Gammaproteobacteria bacterium]|jgi:DNA repair protein RadC|nr:DNA repair protein RadC [Gammaproteobacteria bacterium]MBU0856957.1 DNA repair protein RadC [Gammaproteobacteria bacterium]MBU1848258.1 DNA repair protein RadC [Gammaproteobacteria bacterium]